MSKKIGFGWAQIGEWFGDICVLLPMALAVIGMLIALVIGALDWTGVGGSLAWIRPANSSQTCSIVFS
jgi:hypothetical protein